MQVEKTRPERRTSYLWVWQGLHIPGRKWLSTFLCLFVLRCPWSLGGGICHRCLWIWEYWLWFQSGKSPTLSYSIPEIPGRGEKVHIYTHTHIYIHIHICIHTEGGHTISVTGYCCNTCHIYQRFQHCWKAIVQEPCTGRSTPQSQSRRASISNWEDRGTARPVTYYHRHWRLETELPFQDTSYLLTCFNKVFARFACLIITLNVLLPFFRQGISYLYTRKCFLGRNQL